MLVNPFYRLTLVSGDRSDKLHLSWGGHKSPSPLTSVWARQGKASRSRLSSLESLAFRGTLAVWLLGCKALWVTAVLSLPRPQFLLVGEAGR